jgi:hypothetical protein
MIFAIINSLVKKSDPIRSLCNEKTSNGKELLKCQGILPFKSTQLRTFI